MTVIYLVSGAWWFLLRNLPQLNFPDMMIYRAKLEYVMNTAMHF